MSEGAEQWSVQDITTIEEQGDVFKPTKRITCLRLESDANVDTGSGVKSAEEGDYVCTDGHKIWVETDESLDDQGYELA
jgi:hypothetical protein